MTTRRFGHGMAVSPEKNLALFSDMAARGQALVGISALGFMWRFKPAPAEDAVFALDYNDTPDEDYLAVFEAAGWQHVLGICDMQIFKAAPGTRPIHTERQGEKETLASQARRHGLAAIVFLVLMVLAFAVHITLELPRWVDVILYLVTVIPFIFTAIPWIGSMRLLRKQGRQRA